jgi:hypothetical protein
LTVYQSLDSSINDLCTHPGERITALIATHPLTEAIMSRREQNTPQVRPKPFTLAMLDDVDGGQEGLLPKSTQGQPLRVEFAPWTNTDPSPEFPESVELFWNARSVDTKVWTAPIASGDYYIDVPSSWLTHGRHEVEYLLTLGSSQTEESEVRILTVDIEPPMLDSSSQLIFPSEVSLPNAITAAYLADPANEDKVLATLPDYNEIKVGDVIIWYWELSPGGREIADTWTLGPDDLGKMLRLPFSGELLRSSGNGTRYATYRVRDRAGNESVLSRDVSLNVNIRPPTQRKYPTVKQATNTNATGVLNPFLGSAGVTVVVEASEVDPGEEVTVDFVGLGGEAGVGSVSGVKPTIPGGLEFAIPASVVAANIPVNGDGRQVEVHYWAGHDVQHSAVYSLSINAFATDALGQVACLQAQVGVPATLSKAAVTANGGANLEIEKWVYQDPAQLMKVWAIASGTRTDFIDGVLLGIDGTFTTLVPQDYVIGQPLNSTLSLYASVSFDGGHSYIPFKTLPLKVVA